MREALTRFGEALGVLDQEQRRLRTPVFTQNLFGESVLAAPIVAEPRRLYELDRLVEQWGGLSRGFASRMDRVRDELLPAVARWQGGDDGAHGRALEVLASVQGEREGLERRLASIRTQVVFVEPLKPMLMALTQAIERCDMAEDGEVFPAILSGARETQKPEARRRTSSDVARSLRTSRPAEPVLEPVPPGLFGKIKKLFGR